VFERFPDLNALRVAATDYALAQAAALAPARQIDGDRRTRVDSQTEHVRRLATRRCLWRVLMNFEKESDELKLRVRRRAIVPWPASN